VPVPASSSELGGRAASAARHWRVEACEPVPKAMPTSMITSSVPGSDGAQAAAR